MPSRQYAVYKPVAPYFDLARGALGDLVDGAHFFDVVDDDISYEVLYDFPGWPRVVRGRAALMAQFRATPNTSRSMRISSSSTRRMTGESS